MFWAVAVCGLFFVSVTLGQETTTLAGVPPSTAPSSPVAVPVVHVAAVVESVKLATKDWRNYKGCEDTCFSLCLENPTSYDNKCSVLFSNNTLVNTPNSESCRKSDVIRDCTYQCQCSCKRCGFCKQELVNSCADNADPGVCFNRVLDDIILHNKCD